MLKRMRTEEIYKQLCTLIPGGVNSPVRACSQMGQLPMIVDAGFKDTLTDVDGHTYIDYCGSWGALIHGHAAPEILKAVQERMLKGTSFGITTAIEEKLAHAIVKAIDSIDMIRFVSSGTEATMSVVRLARGYTKRKWIIKFAGNYHGHADFFLVQAGSGVLGLNPTSTSAGIPEEIVKYTLCLPYNDREACRKIFDSPQYRDQIAAVILEPIAGNMGVVPADPAFLQFLRTETEKQGILLIFDEVISGFRVGMEGAQGLYQIKPDLTCFGKIMGGGFPAAAFGGRKEVMQMLAPLGPVYQAGTLSGNPIAMEAGVQALRLLQTPNFYKELQRKTDLLIKPIKVWIKQNNYRACIQQVGSMFTLFFGIEEVKNMKEAQHSDTETYSALFRYLFDRGIYIPPSQYEAWFVSQAHEEHNLIKTKEAIIEFLEQNSALKGIKR